MQPNDLEATPIEVVQPAPTYERSAIADVMQYAGQLARRGAAVFLLAATLAAGACAPSHKNNEGGNYYPSAAAAYTTTLGHVARLGADGCSALILEHDHVAVAALTATHCLAANPRRLDQTPFKSDFVWHTGADGKQYRVEPLNEQLVQTGPASNDMTTVGTASELLVPTDGNTDQGVIVLAGHTEQEALDAYNQALAGPDVIASLQPGQGINLIGWPAMQNGDGQGNQLRQELQTAFITTGTIQTETGKTMHVAWLACPTNANGATCFHGISGASAFVTVKTADGYKVEVLGTVYGPNGTYTSMDPNSPDAPPIVRDNPGLVDWSKYTNVTAIALDHLETGDITPLHVVSNADQIPGNSSVTPTPAADAAPSGVRLWTVRRPVTAAAY